MKLLPIRDKLRGIKCERQQMQICDRRTQHLNCMRLSHILNVYVYFNRSIVCKHTAISSLPLVYLCFAARTAVDAA